MNSYKIFFEWEGIGFPGIRRSAVLTCVQRLENAGHLDDIGLCLGGYVMAASRCVC